MTEEANPEAATILRDAGWTPHPEWGVYTRATLVMGGIGGALHVKDYSRIPPGHPQYGPDTPDTAEEAAAWLVERFKPASVEENALSLDSLEFRIEDEIAGLLKTHLATAPEADETPQHESDGETGETLDGAADGGDACGVDFLDAEPGSGGSGVSRDEAPDNVEPLDADFTIEDLGGPEEEEALADLPALEGADLVEPDEPGEPEEEAPQGQDRFIGLDDLDRRRSLRIGDVIRYANSLMPSWSIEDDARLATLRNFAMGVSEKRWDDNPANQAELNALETTIRRINEIKNARDAKVEFLESARREDVEAFVVEADWP